MRLLLLLAAAVAAPALAAAAPIEIGRPWIRATPNGAMTAAGYVTLTNRGGAVDQLLGGSSPVARNVTAHRSVMSGGMMRMSAVASLPIAPGQTVSFDPGGYHLMLVGLKAPLTVGQRVPVTLNFARAGAVPVVFTVEQPGAATMAHKH